MTYFFIAITNGQQKVLCYTLIQALSQFNGQLLIIKMLYPFLSVTEPLCETGMI